ncbi:hypothetical protein DSO57_1035579 [Entomophthora muscae]|uniref:Uncharacterized protein n=1 Tax=Entomophthora muscae TaxID=34485 RepID=A0ACC2U935_9FUNG|nr:hypothetical protein DSO57_1035579 [Entomophthora muscae]
MDGARRVRFLHKKALKLLASHEGLGYASVGKRRVIRLGCSQGPTGVGMILSLAMANNKKSNWLCTLDSHCWAGWMYSPFYTSSETHPINDLPPHHSQN